MANNLERRHGDPLSDREIVRLHQLAANGTIYPDLARMFRCHVNTIIDHLALRVCYPRSVYKAIGKLKPIPSAEPISIYDAAIFLPGWPSRDKVYRLTVAGILKAWKHQRNLITDFAEIKRAAKLMFPHEGIWISNRAIDSFIRLDTIEKLSPFIRKLSYWPSKEIWFYPMPRVFEAAIETNETVDIPAAIIHRCLKIDEIASVATI